MQNSSYQDTVRSDLAAHIREEGHGAVTAIANQVRVSRQYLHEFLVGRDIGAAKLASITEFLALKGFLGYEVPVGMSVDRVAEEHGRSTFSRDTMCMQCGQLTPAPPRGKFCCACGQRLAFQCPNADCGLWNILNTGVSPEDTIVCQRCGTALRGTK